MDNKILKNILQVVVAILLLFILLLTGVRMLLTDTFVTVEYGMPYFPEDNYGMSQEERLGMASFALAYLLNAEDITFLEEVSFADGTPAYNDRELRHMVDVKVLTQSVLKGWYWSLGVFAGLAAWAWFGGWWNDFRKMLSVGGVFTVVLLGTLVFLVFLNFNQVFTSFHHLFFEGDSWLFLYSDTLIRLFPIRFWQDAFTFVGVFTFVLGLGIWRWAPVRIKS
ncbi:MAG: TIGR01906 family membrane protein [Chloroflexota bacterium]